MSTPLQRPHRPRRAALLFLAAAVVLVGAGVREAVRGSLPTIPADTVPAEVFAHTTGDGVSLVADAEMADRPIVGGDSPIVTPGPASVPSPATGLLIGGPAFIVGSACTDVASDPPTAPQFCYGVFRMTDLDPSRDYYELNVTVTRAEGASPRWVVLRAEPQMAASAFEAWPGQRVDGPCGTVTAEDFGDEPHCGSAAGRDTGAGVWQLDWQCSQECAEEIANGGRGVTPLVYVVSVAEGTAPDWRILAAFG